MKILVLSLSLFLNLDAFAQFSVAPFGASGGGIPPIGQSRKNNCGSGACSFELNVKPYCFGTNLRAFSYDRQMNPSQDITMTLNMADPKTPTKKDELKVVFPARMTWGSAGVRTDCMFKEGQDMSKSGYKDMTCFVPWKKANYDYKLAGWLEKTNPQGNPYLGAQFAKYGGVPLYATLVGTPDEEVDSQITCLYKFTQYNKHGSLTSSAVSCYYPSRLPDLSHLVKVYKEGKELTNVEVEAHTNNIKIRYKDPMNAIIGNNAIKHGKILIDRPPRHSISFTQPGNNGSTRVLAAQRELESFDEATAYQTFTAQVKFPGMEGFCGGYYSPLMLFFDQKLPQFSGVSLFSLYGVKEGTRVNWPEEKAPGYFLAHLKGEESITSDAQLFGKNADHENGFLSLKIHDKNGDNVIDSKDAIFKELRLWNDANGDGVSESSELSTLKSKGVTAISLKYTSRDVTKFGDRARARERSQFTFVRDGKVKQGEVLDIWLSPLE